MTCWNYPRALDNKGYGRIWFDGRLWRAHRLAYLWHHGVDAGTLMVCHSCDNPACYNPEHLFLDDARGNSGDMVTKGRSCAGSRQGRSKLTAEQVEFIRKSDDLHRHLAKRFGVSRSNIGAIKNGLSWKES